MKQIINDNTVKNVRRWAGVVSRLSDSLSGLKANRDTLHLAHKIRGKPEKREVLWRNFKKNKLAENLPVSWIRDVVKNISDEIDVEDGRVSSPITVPSHKYRSCLIALMEAAKNKLNQSIRTMDSRLTTTRGAIKATNDRLEILGHHIGNVELLVPHVSTILNPDDYNPTDRLDDPVRIPENDANPEGSQDSSAG